MSLPRWALNAQASTLRGTINFAQNYLSAPIYGYYAHTPFAHSYTLTIPAKTSSIPGTINLIVYTPPSHSSPPSKDPQSSESSSASNSASKKNPLPCVLNFHGGGFVIGVGIDDERWARACVEQLNAVVVSVEYRLAPQHVFPTAVQDSVDAYLYIQEHAKDLGIDVDNIVTSGFSSGGSLAFTVPLMLFNMMREGMGKGEANNQEMGKGVKAVVSFYPATDSTRSREVRASSMALPEKKLPVWLTNIFDDSYRYCAEGNLDLTSPYLSPGLAPAELIEKAIPKDILVYTCEHDMLCFEGKIFAERLEKEGKNVVYKCVEGAPHAWDKGPNPLPKPEPIYAEACEHLKRVLRIESQAIEES